VRFGTVLVASFCLLVGMTSVAFGLPDVEDIENTALDYVRSSQNYVDYGGFDERVVGIEIFEDFSFAVVEYHTRHVGMLQMIGNFVSRLTINSTSLDVVGCSTEETRESVEPGNSSGGEPGLPADPTDPDSGPGESDDEYRLRIYYTINMTRAMIYENGAEDDLAEALNMLDRAEELLNRGDPDGAWNLAFSAHEMAKNHIDEGDEEPVMSDPEPSTAPWLEGYIVVFDHEPDEEDRQKLESMFNATCIDDAVEYTKEEHAYWVRVSGTSPEDLKQMMGVRDVLVLRGGPDAPGDSKGESSGDEQAVAEPLVSSLGFFLCGFLALRIRSGPWIRAEQPWVHTNSQWSTRRVAAPQPNQDPVGRRLGERLLVPCSACHVPEV